MSPLWSLLNIWYRIWSPKFPLVCCCKKQQKTNSGHFATHKNLLEKSEIHPKTIWGTFAVGGSREWTSLSFEHHYHMIVHKHILKMRLLGKPVITGWWVSEYVCVRACSLRVFGCVCIYVRQSGRTELLISPEPIVSLRPWPRWQQHTHTYMSTHTHAYMHACAHLYTHAGMHLFLLNPNLNHNPSGVLLC